jgi:hypothetical protein
LKAYSQPAIRPTQSPGILKVSCRKLPIAPGIFKNPGARIDIANERIRIAMNTASKSKPVEVKTAPPTRKESTPRLPHERDESRDSQASQPGPPRDDIKQAYKDLMNGQVDTDLRETRGVDAVVNNPPGPSPRNPSDAPQPRKKK